MSDLIYGIDNSVLIIFIFFIISVIAFLAYGVKGQPSAQNIPPANAGNPPRRIGSDQYFQAKITRKKLSDLFRKYTKRSASKLWTYLLCRVHK